MAVAAILISGFFGFISFLVGLIGFDLSLTAALSVYAYTGCATICGLFALRAIPRAALRPQAQTT